MQDAVREIAVVTETGKVLRILSNDLDARRRRSPISTSAAGRSSCSSAWVKQMLEITRFLGRSENAVRIQIAVALIAFLILRLLHKIASKARLSRFARLVRANIMHRKDVTIAYAKISRLHQSNISPIDPRLEIY